MAKRYVDTAKAMNIPYVRVLADRNPAPEGEVDDALVAANLSAICGYAAAQGVEILVETNEKEDLYDENLEQEDSDRLSGPDDVHRYGSASVCSHLRICIS